ncbi:hypothetical protein FP2506_12139 [Fulvimarina pelagi HTCC2506]|uniref:Uncharacterized protein n=1 Tax=Fulvimarina pelagi HTCC2506 TaxID=314231 RepID=Q0FYN1_9HYPH|nr:hypothetical protein FP2506_01945 [Fulvimarina pelagi HTCC2506]EAU41013.1 hypothetical protein FP2506_12139 [Fulvimarina pelagi HTCC2506]
MPGAKLWPMAMYFWPHSPFSTAIRAFSAASASVAR